MDRINRPTIQTGSSINLAFAIVVMASYLSIFSSFEPESITILIWLTLIGISYLSVGVYGYSYVSHQPSRSLISAYFLCQMLQGGIIVFLSKGHGFTFLILLPLAGQSVLLLTGLWMYIPALFSAIVYTIAIYGYALNWNTALSSLPIFIAGVFFIMIFTQVAVGEEQARHEVTRLIGDLEAANARLREFATQVEDLAITKERNRMAREIHDGLGHYLTTIYMQIQAALAIMPRDPDTAVTMLEKAQNLSQEALQEVRKSVSTLRSSVEDDTPLQNRIEKLLQDGEGSGIQVVFNVQGKPRELDSKKSITLFRAAQEGFSNTRKHASATLFSVLLDYTDPGFVRMTLQDNGRGADKIEGGFGLIGLRERLNLVDGDCEIYTSKGEGFTLQITVPG
ncbi:sensor histidine kinase [Leptolinea tardivitalis]|uniref:sensor histidine kinase n=1 Tax=Leptolinea tardivitalis TaxID=229920 RepID=UPI0011124D30|nr:sensor histidine kinase [Leptolinea tardivitalis]